MKGGGEVLCGHDDHERGGGEVLCGHDDHAGYIYKFIQ
jgi:hypothetical protein